MVWAESLTPLSGSQAVNTQLLNTSCQGQECEQANDVNDLANFATRLFRQARPERLGHLRKDCKVFVLSTVNYFHSSLYLLETSQCCEAGVEINMQSFTI